MYFDFGVYPLRADPNAPMGSWMTQMKVNHMKQFLLVTLFFCKKKFVTMIHALTHVIISSVFIILFVVKFFFLVPVASEIVDQYDHDNVWLTY